MKRILTIITLIIITFGLTACGQKDGNNTNKTDKKVVQQETDKSNNKKSKLLNTNKEIIKKVLTVKGKKIELKDEIKKELKDPIKINYAKVIYKVLRNKGGGYQNVLLKNNSYRIYYDENGKVNKVYKIIKEKVTDNTERKRMIENSFEYIQIQTLKEKIKNEKDKKIKERLKENLKRSIEDFKRRINDITVKEKIVPYKTYKTKKDFWEVLKELN